MLLSISPSCTWHWKAKYCSCILRAVLTAVPFQPEMFVETQILFNVVNYSEVLSAVWYSVAGK